MGRKEIKKTTCPKCKYSWKSKSKRILVTCPSCGAKVRRAE